MAKKRTFAVKSEYRDGMGAVVSDMLASAGVDYDQPIQFHLDGTVTITLTDAQLEALLASTDVTVYAGPSNAGKVRITTPETDAYFAVNSPVLTDEERAERERKSGSGKRTVDQQEAARRREMLEARKRQLQEMHGVDLDEETDDEE